MAGKLVDFLINISKDSEALSNFQTNPEVAMDAAGLSSSQKAALKSRNADLIRNALEKDAALD